MLLVSISALIFSCAPRGESKTLQEVFKNESERFEQVYALKQNEKSVKNVAKLVNLLADLKDTTLDSQANKLKKAPEDFRIVKVVEEIDRILPSAGYTTRPALTELRNQYEHISTVDTVNKSAMVLLLSRTYGLLADELETVAFQVS